MSMSNKFQNATTHLFDMIMIMIENNAIAEYFNDNATEDMDILYEYVFPSFPTIDEMPDDYKTRVYVNPDSGIGYRGNQATMREVYKVDIVVPNSQAFTNSGKLRAFGIAYEMSKNIDNQHITGIGKAEIIDYKYYKLGDNHVALTFFINIIAQKKRVV